MHLWESISMALAAVWANKLRSGLTLLSISIGIFAIMGAGTAVNSLNNTVTSQLESLGNSTFFIKRTPSIQAGNSWRKYRRRKQLSYAQAREFKNRMTLVSEISSVISTAGYKVKANSLSTDGDVSIIGADAAYFTIDNIDIEFGRPFTEEDVTMNRSVAVIGNDVVKKVFPHFSPIGQKIRVDTKEFTVIGVTKVKGATMGQSQDNMVIMPIPIYMTAYTSEWNQSVTLIAKAPNNDILQSAVDQATGLMRVIRNVKPYEDNDFEIETNSAIKDQFEGFTKYLSFFGGGTGAIALIAAGIGIMNIMLVSVKERTREIGIRKAVGARRSTILAQFIIEAITLCLLGGIFGIILGIIGGTLLSLLMGTTVSLPLMWIVISIGICTLLGVTFGGYPAWKAAQLDPIDALRYE